MNIYAKQMKNLGLNENQYSKLTGIPVDILKKLLKNEKVSEENMSLDDFFRRSTVKVHEELESNNENTKMESIKIKMEDEKNNQEILDWYNNEYTKDKLLEMTKCKSVDEFGRKYKIIVNGKRASRWFYTCIVGTNVHNVRKEVIAEFATQLKDIIDGNVSKYRDYATKDFGKTATKNNELSKWWAKFDFNKFQKEHNLKSGEMIEALKIPASTYYALKSKRGDLGEKWLATVKKYVDSIEGKKNEEPIETLDEVVNNEEPIEIIDEMENATPMFDSNAYVRELVKNSLTEKEKWLITLFGGNI